jgi:hypothetical protein
VPVGRSTASGPPGLAAGPKSCVAAHRGDRPAAISDVRSPSRRSRLAWGRACSILGCGSATHSVSYAFAVTVDASESSTVTREGSARGARKKAEPRRALKRNQLADRPIEWRGHPPTSMNPARTARLALRSGSLGRRLRLRRPQRPPLRARSSSIYSTARRSSIISLN